MKSLLIRTIILTTIIIISTFLLLYNDFFYSIIPGWNTIIYPLWQIILVIILFAFAIIILTSILVSIFKLINSKNKRKTL